MGRAFEAVRTRDLEGLFAFFGVTARSEVLEARRAAIAARFTLEVQEIVRLCRNLHEQERHKLFREALRLAYQSSAGDEAGLARPGGGRPPSARAWLRTARPRPPPEGPDRSRP